MRRSGIRAALFGIAAAAWGLAAATPASAYLFWKKPDFNGGAVNGNEPGIVLAMPGATDKELNASMLWSFRAGLNVAALKCQFAPILGTVPNYNSILAGHARELNDAYGVVQGYFKRTGGKTWQTAFDQYTTRTYNGFSTFHGEVGFCDTAAMIGREAIAQRRGDLHLIAESRMREFRNSLLPAGDLIASWRPAQPSAWRATPPLDAKCWDKKDQWVERKCGVLPPEYGAPALANAAPAPGAS